MANMGKEEGAKRDIRIGSGNIEEIESKIEDMEKDLPLSGFQTA